MELYHPEKYPVVTGKGQIGLCTGWSHPERLAQEHPKLLDRIAIMGALYSPNGINHLIRNLCLNPYIRVLYLWRYEELSQTEFGAVATDTLMKIWEFGVDGDRRQGNFTLEEEIPLEVLAAVREQVELRDISSETLEVFLEQPAEESTETYMEPTVFPDPPIRSPETFPSEKYGWSVHSPTIYGAWTQVVERIDRYGMSREVEGGIPIKELHTVVWTVTNEEAEYPDTDLPDDVQTKVGAKKEMIDTYREIFLSSEKDPNIAYTYGERLFAYKDSETNHINQIEESIIRRLKEDPTTRKAYVTTFIPRIDAHSTTQPCMVGMQALLNDEGRLNMIVSFRSHDIYKSALPNAFGLHALQRYICTQTGIPQGVLSIVSHSAHIYEQDFADAKKTAQCWRETIPELTFDTMDKRGACIIRIEGGAIILELKSPFGDMLDSFTTKTADEMIQKLGHLGLLSQIGHALDIGAQLARAEIAMQKGIPFTQDKPITL